MSIGSDNGVKAIPIINDYLDKMPALRPLILVVKGFLSQRDLNNAGNGSLSSYSIINMCISFLQVRAARHVARF